MAITTIKELQTAIAVLEYDKVRQEDELKETFQTLKHDLNPLKLAKEFILNITASPAIQENVMNAGIGFGTGLLAKKLLVGNKGGILNKALGGVIEFAVANLVSKNTENIKDFGMNLFSKIFKRKNNKDHTPDEEL